MASGARGTDERALSSNEFSGVGGQLDNSTDSVTLRGDGWGMARGGCSSAAGNMYVLLLYMLQDQESVSVHRL